MSSASGSASSGALPTADPIEKPKPKRIAKGGGMKLGGKKTGIDSFVDKLESEGVHVSSNASKAMKETAKAVTPSVLESFTLALNISELSTMKCSYLDKSQW